MISDTNKGLSGINPKTLGSTLFIQTVTNAEYHFTFYAGCSGTISSVAEIALSIGTAGTFGIEINGTPVTGLSEVVPTTAGSNTFATGANSFVVGDKITITYAGTTDIVDHSVTINY